MKSAAQPRHTGATPPRDPAWPKVDSAASTRFEVVPLEALRVKPDEVLVLRVPGKFSRDQIEQMSATLKPLGLDGRVLIVADEIDVVVMEAQSDA